MKYVKVKGVNNFVKNSIGIKIQYRIYFDIIVIN
jgi:hypothetical protein